MMRIIPFEQLSSAEEFVQYIVAKRDWSDLSNDCIMDIGCGDGRAKDTIHCLALKFPQFKKIIGIDVFDYSAGLRSDADIVIQLADITDISTLKKWIGGVTKITSHNCFNCFNAHRTAFENVFHLLAPGGEAAIEFDLQTDFFNWLHDVTQRWPELSKRINSNKPLSHMEKRRAPYYAEMLKDIGFNVLACEDESVLYVFSSDDQCRNYLGQVGFSLDTCTEDQKKLIKEDWFETFMRYTKRDRKGKITMKNVFLRVIIEKPKA